MLCFKGENDAQHEIHGIVQIGRLVYIQYELAVRGHHGHKHT